MRIETFINNESKKYQKKAIANKNKRVNLDKLESMFRKHQENCEEFIEKQDLSYTEQWTYKNQARDTLQSVDNELFGCFNDKGLCIGYDFYGKQNWY